MILLNGRRMGGQEIGNFLLNYGELLLHFFDIEHGLASNVEFAHLLEHLSFDHLCITFELVQELPNLIVVLMAAKTGLQFEDDYAFEIGVLEFSPLLP